MIKAVIFDLNGVFLQSELLSSRFNQRFGVPTDQFVEALKSIMAVARKPGLKDSFVLWKQYLDQWKVRIDQKEFFDFWFQGETLVKELIDYSRELRQSGVKVIILSNNFRERTEYYRTNFPEIFQVTDIAYFSWETGYVKPDENAFKLIFKDLGVKPEECLYFDDQDKNVEIARSLGIIAEKYEGIERAKAMVESFGINPHRQETRK